MYLEDTNRHIELLFLVNSEHYIATAKHLKCPVSCPLSRCLNEI